MHSFIIISNPKEAIDIANEHSPYKVKEEIDNFFIDSEEKIGIDTIREIKKFLSNKPYQNSHKIIFIKNSDLLTLQAQNSFLKTLEEPPGDSLIFLHTTNIDKLLPTIISRCHIIKSKTQTSNENQDSTSFGELYKQLSSKNPGEKVTLANESAYPKTKAISLTKQSIMFFKDSLHQAPTLNTSKNLKLANQTLVRLEKNIDPRLSLEHFFLNILI